MPYRPRETWYYLEIASISKSWYLKLVVSEIVPGHVFLSHNYIVIVTIIWNSPFERWHKVWLQINKQKKKKKKDFCLMDC
jgi:hypothetical protein